MLNRFELAKVTHYLNRTKNIYENNIVPSWIVGSIWEQKPH